MNNYHNNLLVRYYSVIVMKIFFINEISLIHLIVNKNKSYKFKINEF